MRTIIEPFRIKTVEPIRMTTRDERERLIAAAVLQFVRLAIRRRDHRPADRFRHLRDERRTTSRSDRAATNLMPEVRPSSASKRP